MNRTLEKILFPLLLVNITTSANEWELAGIGIGQSTFWITIALGLFVAINTPYRVAALFLFASALVLRVVETFTGSAIADGLGVAALGMIFMIAGAKIYGRNPRLLHQQLTVFLALSIPVMLLQISGAGSFWMGWNTEYAHDLSVLDLDEIGTFRKIPVYPTLFVGNNEVFYQIGQGRPVGLLYSNNVLSIFVAIAAALNLALARSARSRVSDWVVSASLVLTMSLMALVIAVGVYLGFAAFGAGWQRRRAGKLMLCLLAFLGMYWVLFPGLFLRSFSDAKLWSSLLTRLLDLANVFGWTAVGDMFADQRVYIGAAFSEEGTYSFYAKMLKSEVALPATVALLLLVIVYVTRLRRVRRTTKSGYGGYGVYGVIAGVCALTQLAVAYVAAPAFQLILGLAFFPLFKKLWREGRAPRPAGQHALPGDAPAQ